MGKGSIKKSLDPSQVAYNNVSTHKRGFAEAMEDNAQKVSAVLYWNLKRRNNN